MLNLQRKTVIGYLIAANGVAAVTVVFWGVRGYLQEGYASLLYLLVVVASATMSGTGPAILAALLGFLSWNFFFIEPTGTFYVHNPKEWLALFVFLVIGVLCGQLAGRAREAGQVEALRETDKLKSALLSSVSHDLRTPLSSIKAAVTSLLQSSTSLDTASQRDLLLSINEASDKLNALIGNLLDLSRIEAGIWQPGKELNDLSDVIGTVLERFDEPCNQRIRISLPPDLPLIPMDYVHIAQVLWNLLDNGLKYSPAHLPVHVAAHSDGSFVTVSVSDEGPGVPASERENIFEKFYRARRQVESSVPGTGMGLAICKGIVEAHGGRIWLRDDSGRGATFYFTLPLTKGGVTDE